MNKCCAYEAPLVPRHTSFPVHFLRDGCGGRKLYKNQMTVNHCKQWRGAYVKLLRDKGSFFCLQMLYSSSCSFTGDIQESVLFFHFGLPTLAGCPLSARTLSTPRFPSIPGLFLCGRQHPASDCLIMLLHPLCFDTDFAPPRQFSAKQPASYFVTSYHHILRRNFSHVASITV